TMLLPLTILAIGSILAGYVGANIFKMVSTNGFFTSAITISLDKFFIYDEIHHISSAIKSIPLVLGVVAIALAYWFYVVNPKIPQMLSKKLSPLYKLSFNKWYFDEFYENVLINPTRNLGKFLWKNVDIRIIDAIPNGSATICRFGSQIISKMQTGLVYHYGAWMAIGMALIGLYFIDFLIPIISNGDTLFGIVKKSFLNLFSFKF
ncbi:MAG: hypothetical protein ACO26G_07035, partial [Rickettsiales bacterium]